MERGSKHILEQKKILEKNPHKKNEAIPNRNIKCNLKAYQFANFISVAYTTCKRKLSFAPISREQDFCQSIWSRSINV